MESSGAVTVVLADPIGVARASLRRLVEATWGWHVIAEAQDGLEAVRVVRIHRPDAVLVDAAIAGMTVDDIRRTLADSETLVVALLERPEQHAGQRGPSALKSIPSDALRDLILDHLRQRWLQSRDSDQDALNTEMEGRGSAGTVSA